MAVPGLFGVEVAVKEAVQEAVGEGVEVGVEAVVEVGEADAVELLVGVAVACATDTVAPATGNPLNDTACPLVPLPPVRLNV